MLFCNSYIFLILLIVSFEAFAQYNIKKKSTTNNWFYMFLAFLSYCVICLLLGKCYEQGDTGVGITNFVWSVLSIVSIITIGMVAFHEKITRYDIFGIICCFVGLYFIFMFRH